MLDFANCLLDRYLELLDDVKIKGFLGEQRHYLAKQQEGGNVSR